MLPYKGWGARLLASTDGQGYKEQKIQAWSGESEEVIVFDHLLLEGFFSVPSLRGEVSAE